VLSPEILHKSDVGGVRIGLGDDQAVEAAFKEIMSSVKAALPDREVLGIGVFSQEPPGTEVIVGMMNDPKFGPMIMFGLGGVHVELLRDVTFRVCPVSAEEARKMVAEIRGYPLLTGWRGAPPCDLDALARLIAVVSEISMERGDLDSIDLNPVALYPAGLRVLDAKFVFLDGDGARSSWVDICPERG
jgi:acyl-CoA synthetase (NDP forming)